MKQLFLIFVLFPMLVFGQYASVGGSANFGGVSSIACAAPGGGSYPAVYVQSTTCNGASTSAFNCPSLTNVAGDTLIVPVLVEGSPSPAPTLSGNGNTYTLVSSCLGSSGTGYQAVYIFEADSIASGANAITVTPGTGTGNIVVAPIEVGGLVANAFDEKACAYGTGTSPSSGPTPSTTQANEFAIGVIGARTAGYSLTLASPYTTVANSGSQANYYYTVNGYDVLNAIGAGPAATGTIGSSQAWYASAATFKASGAGGGPPQLSPSSPATYQGQQVSMSCTNGCGTGGTWSVSGSGSVNAATGVYTAPSSVTAAQSMGGEQLLPNNHVYNTRIDSLPLCVSTNSNCNGYSSAQLIAGAGTQTFNYIPGFPMNYTNNATPTDSMIFAYTPANNAAFQVPAFPNARLENGWFDARTNGNNDHHFLRINTQTGHIQEQYQYYPVGDNVSCPTCDSQSGYQYDASSYALPGMGSGLGSVTAGGTQVTPLMLKVQEVENACATSGSINHAISMTNSVGYDANAFIWPATAYAGSVGGINPFGIRYRLSSSFNISTFSACAQVLLTQLKDYGLVLVDNGTGWQAGAENDAWPANIVAAMTEINDAEIPPSDFEAVDESSLEVSNDSGQTPTGNTQICYTASSGTTCIPVTLNGVAVNLPQNVLYFGAGTPAQQLSAMVNDGASNTVTWTMSPSVGTLTSGGLYTAPASVSSPTSTTITATSTVNSAVSASMIVWTFPAAGIYVIPASTSNYTDSNGKVWTGVFGLGLSTTAAWPGCCNANNEGSFTGTDKQLYWDHYASSFTIGDLNFNFFLPAGNYLITYHYGTQFATGQQAFTFISQGSTLASGIDPTVAAGGQYEDYTYTTTQTVGGNNQLTFSVWGAGGVPTWVGGDVSSISVVPQ